MTSVQNRSADLRAVAHAFRIHGVFRSSEPYGSGHINDTFAVRFDQAGAPVRYIFQRINRRIFRDVPALMDNIHRVTSHVAGRVQVAAGSDASRRALTLVPTRDDRPYHIDADGEYWRCYLFVEGARTYDIVESPRQASEAARAIGRFQSMLTDLPGPRLHETIPDFHHTRSRFEALKSAAKADVCGRAHEVQAELDFAGAREPLVDVLLNLLRSGEMPERITHNDTKLNNVMLDDVTGEGVCVIDLDTVMPGLALYDFGDMVRSATNSAAEDERDVSKVTMRMPIYEGLVSGYVSSAGGFFTPAERAHIAFAGKLITFEIGVRFLTDYLQGDVYFKTRRAGHNLDRCRNQFALVGSIEKQESVMQRLADSILQAA